MMNSFNRFFLIALLLTVTQLGQSQVLLALLFGDKLNSKELSFGFHINNGWNHFSNIEEEKALSSLNLGLFFTYHFNERWHGNVEMLAKYKRGAAGLPVYNLGDSSLNIQFADGKVKRAIGYLSLPMSVQYLFPFGMYVETGPQVSLRINAKDTFEADHEQGDLSLVRDVKKDITTFDVGWLAGVGYRIGKSKLTSIGFRYQAGFVDVIKSLEGSQQNRQWTLYTNIPLGKKSSPDPVETN